jgi:ribonuclease D
VVYTNDVATVGKNLAIYEQWLLEDKHRFVGLGLEYTSRGKHQRIAVMQLTMRQHVLVFHYCRSSSKNIPVLRDFLQHKQITFASVDMRGDKEKLYREQIHIPDEFHVDIQDVFKIKGQGDRDSMGDLAAVFIDASYKEMKKACTSSMHDKWEWKPLSQKHLEYAAKDGHVSYELYRRITSMKGG